MYFLLDGYWGSRNSGCGVVYRIFYSFLYILVSSTYLFVGFTDNVVLIDQFRISGVNIFSFVNINDVDAEYMRRESRIDHRLTT